MPFLSSYVRFILVLGHKIHVSFVFADVGLHAKLRKSNFGNEVMQTTAAVMDCSQGQTIVVCMSCVCAVESQTKSAENFHFRFVWWTTRKCIFVFILFHHFVEKCDERLLCHKCRNKKTIILSHKLRRIQLNPANSSSRWCLSVSFPFDARSESGCGLSALST